jgi:hypothetical protein
MVILQDPRFQNGRSLKRLRSPRVSQPTIRHDDRHATPPASIQRSLFAPIECRSGFALRAAE